MASNCRSIEQAIARGTCSPRCRQPPLYFAHMREPYETQIAFERSMRADCAFLREMLKSLRQAEWQFSAIKLLVAESKRLLARLSSMSQTLKIDKDARHGHGRDPDQQA